MMNAAQGGQAEVTMGQLAQQKGSSEAVKQLGQTLVNDHQTANQQLQQIAHKEGAQLRTSPDPKDQAETDPLQNLNRQQFDQALLKHAVMDHQDIKEFQKEANSGSDPQLKQFAQQQLPTLQKHLQMARQAQQSMGRKSSASSPQQ